MSSTTTSIAEADPSAVAAAVAALMSAQAIASAYDLTLGELQDLMREPHFHFGPAVYCESQGVTSQNTPTCSSLLCAVTVIFSGVCLLSGIILVFLHRRQEKEGGDLPSYPARRRSNNAWRKIYQAPRNAFMSSKLMRPNRPRPGPASEESYLSSRSSMPSEYLNVTKGQSSTTSLPFDSKV